MLVPCSESTVPFKAPSSAPAALCISPSFSPTHASTITQMTLTRPFLLSDTSLIYILLYLLKFTFTLCQFFSHFFPFHHTDSILFSFYLHFCYSPFISSLQGRVSLNSLSIYFSIYFSVILSLSLFLSIPLPHSLIIYIYLFLLFIFHSLTFFSFLSMKNLPPVSCDLCERNGRAVMSWYFPYFLIWPGHTGECGWGDLGEIDL